MVVLGRKVFRSKQEGCCGKIRNDLIYPIGTSGDSYRFQKNALKIVERYKDNGIERINDCISIEQFKGEPGQNERGIGESIYLIEYDNGEWHYYENSEHVFTITNVEELKEKWQL